MNLFEIAQEMTKDLDKYAVRKEVEVMELVQAKTHKKKRINKKYLKRYGQKAIYKKKMAQVVDITVENVVEFCHERGLPLPQEFLTTTQNDQGV